MEKFSKIIIEKRIPVKISVYPYFSDHHFMGKPVLPALEAIRIMTVQARPHLPRLEQANIYHASFDKFLYFLPEQKAIDAFIDLQGFENETFRLSLLTHFKAPKSGITRFLNHATLHFSFTDKDIQEIPFEPSAVLGEDPFRIESEIIYESLVPFGPAYRNILETLWIGPKGGVARVYGGDFKYSDNGAQGSPFVLDAAFHAACVWGQRYAHIVAFPVGFDKRIVLSPPCFGCTYLAVIEMVKVDKNTIFVDIRIRDENADTIEVATGVRMKDVSKGRLKPPSWIMA